MQNSASSKPKTTRNHQRAPAGPRTRQRPRSQARRRRRRKSGRSLAEQLKTRRKEKHRRIKRNAYRALKKDVLSLVTSTEIDELARSTGFYQREAREIRAFPFVLCCALAAVVEGKRGFASVWRLLETAADVSVARSAVTQRFGEGSAALMEEVFKLVASRVDTPPHPELLGKLEQFHQVMGDDGTVITVSPLLAKLYQPTRTNSVDAAAKLHVSADLVHRRVVRVELTGERESELRVVRSQEVVPNTLYIRDLGYYCYDHFAEIFVGGGDMLSRLKSNANPVVIEVRHGVRAPARSVGMKFQEIELADCHDTFDLDAAFPTSVEGEPIPLRVVGRRHPDTGDYHCYVTTLEPERFSVDELAELYARRWIIELLMKLLKSSCHLDHVDTSDADALRTHIYASLTASLLIHAMCVSAAACAGISASEISPLVAGIAAPLLIVPLLFLIFEKEPTPQELAALIMRTLVFGCCDQNPGRTRRKWGALGN